MADSETLAVIYEHGGDNRHCFAIEYFNCIPQDPTVPVHLTICLAISPLVQWLRFHAPNAPHASSWRPPAQSPTGRSRNCLHLPCILLYNKEAVITALYINASYQLRVALTPKEFHKIGRDGQYWSSPCDAAWYGGFSKDTEEKVRHCYHVCTLHVPCCSHASTYFMLHVVEKSGGGNRAPTLYVAC